MRKYLLGFSLLLAFGLILGACSSSNSASSDGKVEIEFWYGLGSEADKKMKEIISDFNAEHEDIEVIPVPQADYTETYEKLQAAIASNTAPGIFIAEVTPMTDLASKEALEPLDKFLDEDDSFDEEDFLASLISPGKMDSSMYMLPGYGSTQVMYYRKDIFENAGVDPEEAFASWENLAEASRKLIDSGEVNVGHMPMWGYENLVDIALSNGGSILNEDGTEVLIDSPEWIESWEFIREQIHDEENMKINSGGQGWEYWYKTIDQVMNGSAASYTGSSGDKGDLDFDKIDSHIQPGLNGKDPAPEVTGLYLGIPSSISEEEKEAAYEWMSYFTSSEVNADWSKTIGYVPTRNSTTEEPVYAEFVKENPYANVPYEQAQISTPEFIDPTGGKIIDALSIATDKVQIENIPVEEALKKAKEDAQAALDEVNNK